MTENEKLKKASFETAFDQLYLDRDIEERYLLFYFFFNNSI
ncbi:hypothetical protein ABIB50_002763 [Mucilaginibacter sp. UYCu711]